jgi:glycosyltransferase involved in cell wall biosynthesis
MAITEFEPGRPGLAGLPPLAVRWGRFGGPRVAFVSTYPPRRCGIAVFTRDLAAAVGHREIVAVRRVDDLIPRGDEVTALVQRDDRLDYLRAADRLSGSGVDVVSIQHEFGIFGGQDGVFILDLVERLRVPAVATLHTVLRHPSPWQREVMARLLARVDTTVVMSEAAAGVLRHIYGVAASRTRVIPHGVPDLPLVDPALRKPELGLEGRLVILSFGLLGPGKGYERVIEAMARVRLEHPTALYVVLGATHPELVRSEGEAYRDRLRKEVDELGLGEHVLFVDRFVAQEDLALWLEAADIFVTPYPNLDQAVSGTLAYAMAAGKAIVSTPYAYALERLAGGRGRLVPTDSAEAFAEALLGLLGDPNERASMGRRAYENSRAMLWPAVGSQYRGLFERAASRAGRSAERETRPDLLTADALS